MLVALPSRSTGADERRQRLLVEALQIAAPAHAELAAIVVEDALLEIHREEVPTIAEGLRSFLGGAFLRAIERRIGADAAERIEESIEVLIRAAALEQENAPAPLRTELGRLVLVASTDADRVAALSQALERHANVEAIAEPAVLPSLMWARLASALVIDCACYPLDEHTLEELTASLDETSRVLLWGASPEMEGSFVRARRGMWLSAARTAGPAHVAGLALALLADDLG